MAEYSYNIRIQNLLLSSAFWLSSVAILHGNECCQGRPSSPDHTAQHSVQRLNQADNFQIVYRLWIHNDCCLPAQGVIFPFLARKIACFSFLTESLEFGNSDGDISLDFISVRGNPDDAPAWHPHHSLHYKEESCTEFNGWNIVKNIQRDATGNNQSFVSEYWIQLGYHRWGD